MFSDPLLFAFSLVDTGSVLFLLIYFIITLSDLECDYLNGNQCCSRLNMWTLPKLFAHGLLWVLLLMHGHLALCFLNLPMLIFLVYQLSTIPKGNVGIYDPTEIYNRGEVKRHMRNCMLHLVYYLTFFFTYLYCMITSMLKEDPLIESVDYSF